ncbi:hypothetical protein TOT_040000012 [Theileria orientalis strain Shintoku]|uniref:Uncharacterized protein n=1 Tax=Theileria orientalis strain Shintoku TaxID=869250 RepID=J4C462_THEOR|nr:hypothetical protein TOT_040000012 [Theileria orientalis strain Shintoku]BAM41631.1 hypothetical protein TOT_040000012 [Theileria orientalis strain Shintoku]|eukprot:XP_009691932.1 hypothetical protein TOT_040000012 [Theileria orientalis strain Shintoku]
MANGLDMLHKRHMLTKHMTQVQCTLWINNHGSMYNGNKWFKYNEIIFDTHFCRTIVAYPGILMANINLYTINTKH